MLGLLIKKEIVDNLLNVRFAGACAISILLIICSIVVLSDQYRRQHQEFLDRAAQQEEFIDKYAHTNRLSWMSRMMREPSRYQPLVLGIDREAAQENFVSNPLPALLTRLDFAAIVTIIMSLMAVLFSYNAVSGEREDGLLKLMLSTSLSRGSLILGKFLGGMMSLLLPFTIGVLFGLVAIAFNPGIRFEPMDASVFLLLLVLSFLYISTFHAATLFCSARSRTSNEAVLKSLFVWVVFVLVLPNIAPPIAAQIATIPSKAQVDEQVNQIASVERDAIIGRRGPEILKSRFPDLSVLYNMSQKDLQSKIQSDPSFKERYGAYTKAWDEMVVEVNKVQQAQAQKILKEFADRTEHQEKLASALALFSPYSNFVFAAADLAETGMNADDRWENLGSAYEQELRSYSDRRYEAEKQKNPTLSSNDYLDLRARPRFHYQPAGLAERAALVLPQLAILAAFTLAFLTLAIFSFLRYDVR